MDQQTEKTNWKAVVAYYILACAISWPFFWWRDIHPDSFRQFPLPTIVKTWSYMWGPALSSIIITLIFKKSKTLVPAVSIFGTSVLKSLLFWFVPFLLLAVPGIENSWNLNPHLFPIVAMGLLGFISIIGEDMGWSLFLKNALIHLSPLKRSILIGVLWELWHFTNRTAHKTPIHAIASVSIMMAFLIALTLVLNKITDRTKSLITAITIHMWINVLAENGSPAVYIVFGISLVFWTIMYLKWDHPIWRTKKSTDYLS